MNATWCPIAAMNISMQMAKFYKVGGLNRVYTGTPVAQKKEERALPEVLYQSIGRRTISTLQRVQLSPMPRGWKSRLTALIIKKIKSFRRG